MRNQLIPPNTPKVIIIAIGLSSDCFYSELLCNIYLIHNLINKNKGLASGPPALGISWVLWWSASMPVGVTLLRSSTLKAHPVIWFHTRSHQRHTLTPLRTCTDWYCYSHHAFAFIFFFHFLSRVFVFWHLILPLLLFLEGCCCCWCCCPSLLFHQSKYNIDAI